MKRICIFTSVHSALDTRIFHKQAKSLVKAGYDVTLIAQHAKNEVKDGVKIVALPKPKNRFRRMLGTWRAFRLALKQKADIYHFHDPELLPWGWLLQKLTHKPVIYDVHEFFVDTILFKYWIPSFLRKPIAWIFNIIEKTIAGRLAAMVTVTDSMKQMFAGCRGRCISVCNFPNLDTVTAAGRSQGSAKRKDEYAVIYTGAIAQSKGFETILAAMDLVAKQNPGATCLVLAEAKNLGWLGEERQRLMNRLIKRGNLKIMGRVPHEAVFGYLNAAAIGWTPSPPYQRGGVSTKSLEYMACGKPIVCSNLPLTTEIIREAGCGILVDPYDAQAHASAILYLLEHPDEAKKIGAKGKKAILEKYNWETESKKLLELYRVISR
jgi:glycosyltransferase involved in cell wall biosynthesis